MLRSLIFTFLFFSFQSLKAEPTLNQLINNAQWKDYTPENSHLKDTLGDAAFLWSVDAPQEIISDKKIIARTPYAIFKPNTIVEAQRITKAGFNIYNVKYTIDAKSRRLTKTNSTAQKSIILLGCSLTFGTGVNDSETFPFYLSQLRPDSNIYNLGIYSAGANDILDDLRSFKRFEDIPKTGNVVLYTAIYDHIERSTCTLNCYRPSYRGWVLPKSNYVYDEETHQLNRIGSFADSRPIKGPLFRLMADISLFDKVSIPRELSQAQINLYIQMILEMKKTSREKFNADFYFTFYPGTYAHWDKIKTALDENSIKYFDLSAVDLKDITDGRNIILLDGHPTKLANYIFANLIHSRLPQHPIPLKSSNKKE